VSSLILSPAQLAAVRARRKTRVTLPRDQHPQFGFLKACPLHYGHVYRARVQNAGWTAQDLREHRAWAQDEYPSRAHAVLAYLDEPLDSALTARAPVQVTVLATSLVTLGSVTHEDARREGWQVRDQFENHWRSRYGRWDPSELVWVVSFAVGDLRDQLDMPRLLKATPGTVSGKPEATPEHQDYTARVDQAMGGSADPGEGVDARTLERFAAEGIAGHAKRNRAELRRQYVRSATKRLHDAERLNDPEAYAAALGDLQRLHAQIGVAA
jgi:hypothetical protein